MPIDADALYDEVAVADYLGLSKRTLCNSRSSGQLAGVPAPRYVKFGRNVRYRGSTILTWIAQFAERASTETQ